MEDDEACVGAGEDGAARCSSGATCTGSLGIRGALAETGDSNKVGLSSCFGPVQGREASRRMGVGTPMETNLSQGFGGSALCAAKPGKNLPASFASCT